MSQETLTKDPELQLFNEALKAFEVQAFNFATRYIKDSKVRSEYISKSKVVSKEYFIKVEKGILTPAIAAKEVQSLRNEIMSLARLKTSDIGKAKASSLKSTGKTLEDLCEYYAKKMFGSNFSSLSTNNQDKVYKEIIQAAGRTRPSVNVKMQNLSRASRGLLVLSLGIAIYNVATADDKAKAAGNEGVMIGGGFVGGAAGGALAGTACGPGAPVCVTIGVFVGGLLGAFGADLAFDSIF